MFRANARISRQSISSITEEAFPRLGTAMSLPRFSPQRINVHSPAQRFQSNKDAGVTWQGCLIDGFE
jgi:hypothetical protein